MTEPISRDTFRSALSQLAGGVTVITAVNQLKAVGFTATAFSSVSLDPPLVLVCVAKRASAHDTAMLAPMFGVSILSLDQRRIAEKFATSGIDRFEGVAVRVASVPLIEGALVQMECRRYAVHEAGDHTILVGEVIDVVLGSGRPLLHYSRQFGEFAHLE